uniref:MHD domain-containing protein n=1 Tax=Tetranychus urticae TaxID=32264 RepID=T1L4X5_TETUR
MKCWIMGILLQRESNILKELIKPPNLLRTIANTVTGKSNLSFINPRLFDDVSFHPCVRYRRWESERVLSFIPPDGNFRLMSYTIGAQNIVSIPIFVRHLISFREVGGGKMEIRVGPKQTNGRTLDGVVLEIPMPKTVLNVNLSPNQGKYSFDPVSKLLVWEIGRIETGKIPIIFGYL